MILDKDEIKQNKKKSNHNFYKCANVSSELFWINYFLGHFFFLMPFSFLSKAQQIYLSEQNGKKKHINSWKKKKRNKKK